MAKPRSIKQQSSPHIFAGFAKILTVISLRQHIPMPMQCRCLRHLAVLDLSFDRHLLEYLSANPTGTKTTPICFVDPPMPLADSGSPGSIRPEDRVPRAMCTAASVAVPRLSPFWAPVSQRTSPGSRATNVHEAPMKKGLRSVCPDAAMNPLELSSNFPARLPCTSVVPTVDAVSLIPVRTFVSPVSEFATPYTPCT